eukprot:TRINITY_DN670_c0_g1_i3.p1 TRINITY_DN670_c0_g1~~TRINITY_DN670_c0_g1_i3.p1  ORF type:complete len:253 (+),score=46.98 TRINITY_DN670_c0_g1_i3:67-825(+)
MRALLAFAFVLCLCVPAQSTQAQPADADEIAFASKDDLDSSYASEDNDDSSENDDEQDDEDEVAEEDDSTALKRAGKFRWTLKSLKRLREHLKFRKKFNRLMRKDRIPAKSRREKFIDRFAAKFKKTADKTGHPFAFGYRWKEKVKKVKDAERFESRLKTFTGTMFPKLKASTTTTTTTTTTVRVLSFPGCLPGCLTKGYRRGKFFPMHQKIGRIYKVFDKCWKAKTTCFGCLPKPQSHPRDLKRLNRCPIR